MPLTSVSAGSGSLVISWSFSVPVQSVWAGLTDPTLLPQWPGQPLKHDVSAGGIIALDHGGGTLSRSVVSGVDPLRRLAMSWEFPEEPESRIGFTLHPADAGTTMELAHSGLGSLVGPYGPGWITHLTFMEAAVAGVPLPWSQFWPLYASFEVLCGGEASSARWA